MSQETIFYIHGTPTSQSHLLNNSCGILRIYFHEHWNLCDHKSTHQPCCIIEYRMVPHLQFLWLIYLLSLWICTVSWNNGALSISFSYVISASFGRYSVVIDDINFPSTFVKSSGVWTIVWPDLIFRKTIFLRVPPTPSIGPCCGISHYRTKKFYSQEKGC